MVMEKGCVWGMLSSEVLHAYDAAQLMVARRKEGRGTSIVQLRMGNLLTQNTKVNLRFGDNFAYWYQVKLGRREC